MVFNLSIIIRIAFLTKYKLSKTPIDLILKLKLSGIVRRFASNRSQSLIANATLFEMDSSNLAFAASLRPSTEDCLVNFS